MSLMLGNHMKTIFRIMLKIQTILLKFLETADMMSDYW